MMKSIINRLNNRGTIISLVALIVSLLMQFGFNIDSENIMGIVQTVCSILILLGVMNNPVDNTAMYIPAISDKLSEKNKEE